METAIVDEVFGQKPRSNRLVPLFVLCYRFSVLTYFEISTSKCVTGAEYIESEMLADRHIIIDE